MADYYPLIARAVAGLEKNTGDARRVLYERARAALVAQLRGVTPALDESHVTRERLSLEEAIRKVEGESARQSTSRRETARVKAPEFPRWDAPEPEPDSEPEPEPAPRPPPRGTQPAPRQDARPAAPAPSVRSKAEPRHADSNADSNYDPSIPADPQEPPPRNAARPRPAGERYAGERRSLLDSGADELGGALARATRSAREGLAAVPASPAANRSQQSAPDSDEAYLTLDDITEPVMLEPSFIVDESRPVPPRARQARPAELDRESMPPRSYGDLIRIAIAVAIVVGIGSVLIWQWPNMVAIYGMLRSPPVEVAPVNQPASKPKIADRIEPGGKPSQQQTSPDVAAVAQRVVLYEEDPNDPQGKRSVGSAIWRAEAVSPGAGKPPELAVRADIEIPERKISMTWTLRRDTDSNRSTSHTIEIMFKLPPDFPSGGIFNVPGIWMKQAEQTQGTALAGLAVKVTAGYFLIGLSAAPADRERNIQLLKERPWFDIPIVYTNNRRAILAMEKGTPGERAFAQAFAAWEKQ